jgi:hypothetical protein
MDAVALDLEGLIYLILAIVQLMRQKPCCQRCRDLSLAAALYQSAIRPWVPLALPAAMTANEKALTKPMRCAETAEAAQNRDFGKELVSRPSGRSRGP